MDVSRFSGRIQAQWAYPGLVGVSKFCSTEKGSRMGPMFKSSYLFQIKIENNDTKEYGLQNKKNIEDHLK